ncbi:MAG: terminase small subunit [Candidatus Magasanikbacteria bacterium]
MAKIKKQKLKILDPGPGHRNNIEDHGSIVIQKATAESHKIRLGLMKPEEKSLTDKEVLLAEQYVIHGDYHRAGMAAGYAKMNARVSAMRNLKRPHVRAYVEKLRKERAKRCRVTSDQVIEELMKIGFSNICDIISWNANKKEITLRSYDSIPDSVKACIQEISESPGPRGRGKVIKLKLYDKPQALTQIGRHLGMFTDKVQHGGEVDVKNLFEHLAKLDRGV